MVRAPSFDRNGMKKGAWSEEEDDKLRAHVNEHGHSNWRLLPIFAGLARGGKSCRLRWVNYLKPGLRRGNFTKHEEDLIITLQAQLGNKWSAIAAKLPGRTDNEVKNYWHAHITKSSRRNSTGTKLWKNQMQTTEFDITTDDHEEKPDDHEEKPVSENVFESNSKENFPSFIEEELYDFGLLSHEMQNNNATGFDSSNNSTINSNWYSTEQLQENLCCGLLDQEDTYNIVLW